MDDPFSNKLPLLQLEISPQSFPTKCKNLLSSLPPKDLLIITTESQALKPLSSSQLPTTLSSSAQTILSPSQNIPPCSKKLPYWVSMGGEIFFAGQFASLATPKQIDTLFSAFSIPWKAVDVIEGEFDVNEEMNGIWWEVVAYRYHQRARCLKNVRDEEAMYRPCSWVEGADLSQAAVAVGRFWDGKVGFVGDLDDGEESARALRGIMANV